MTSPSPASISPVQDIVAEMRAGRMVILVDEEDRENEGDLVLAADHVTPEAINFMARFGRGLICLTLTPRALRVPQAPAHGHAQRHGVQHGLHGLHRGSRRRDHWHLGRRPRRTVQVAVAGDSLASDPCNRATSSAAGGGRRRADARRPYRGRLRPVCHGWLQPRRRDLRDHERRRHHGAPARPAGVRGRARHQDRHDCRPDRTPQPHRVAGRNRGRASAANPYGAFTAHAFRDKPSGAVHLALVKGQWAADDVVPVRVHEPLSVLDTLEVNRSMHSWGLDTSLQYIDQQGKGVAVLLNCGESAAQLLAQFEGTARAAQAPERGRMDLRTYGVGAQILRECGVHKMQLMGQPRRMPSMAGYGLEITGYIPKE